MTSSTVEAEKKGPRRTERLSTGRRRHRWELCGVRMRGGESKSSQPTYRRIANRGRGRSKARQAATGQE
jgi:hypothetical protein